MKFKYCPECGSKLIEKGIGDEGLTPFCEKCEVPLFDMFASCVITLIVNELNEALLLRQDYISTKYYNLISGYMKPGETAEFTAQREVEEETGISPSDMQLIGTYWFGKKDMLMIGFIGKAKKSSFILSDEVNDAKWIPIEEAIRLVHPKGSVSYALVEAFLENPANY